RHFGLRSWDVFRPTQVISRANVGRSVWLGDGSVSRSACLSPLIRHRAVADHKKNQDEQKYPDRTGEVPLIEISHLGPSTPSVTTIWKDRWEVLAHVRYSLDCAAHRSLLPKKRNVRERPEKEKEQRPKASDCARIEKHLPKCH